jgi:DNA invertase Pin-like site-specific DNA recombinase
MQTSELTVALLYRRVSDEERQRVKGLSLGVQSKDLEKFVQEQRWIVGGEYEDAHEGTWVQRPGYQKMLTEARRLRQEGWRVVLVVRWLHRLGRNLAESIRCRDEMQALGVDIWSVAEGHIGTSSSDRLKANLQAMVAQYEVEQTSERVRAVLGSLRDAGFHNGGRVAWGYRWRPATAEEIAQGAPKRGRVLEEDPVAGPYVREAFARVVGGASCREVAAWIAALPDDVKRDERGRARKLAWQNVRNILSAPVYIARHEVRLDSGNEYVTGKDGKKRRAYRYSREPDDVLAQPQGRWPALADDATWLKVQERIRGHKKLPRQASGRYLLTGLARCPKCRGRLVGTYKNNGRHKPRYHCAWGILHKACNYSITGPIIEYMTLDRVYDVVNNVANDWKGKTARMLLSVAPRDGDQAKARRAEELQALIEKLERRRTGAQDALYDKAISFAEYRASIARIDAELTPARTELEGLRGRVQGTADVDIVLANVGAWQDTLKSGTTQERREVLRLLVDKVFPVRYGPTEREYDVQMEWSQLGATTVWLSTAKGRIEAGLAEPQVSAT